MINLRAFIIGCLVSTGIGALIIAVLWLRITRRFPSMRVFMRPADLLLSGYAALAVACVLMVLATPGLGSIENGEFTADLFVLIQMLLATSTFGLLIVAHRRVITSLERSAAEREQLAQGLQASQARANLILNRIHDSYWVPDGQGHILEVNDSFCDLVGYTRAELLRMSSPDVEAETRPAPNRAARYEEQYRRKDGQRVDVDVKATACLGRLAFWPSARTSPGASARKSSGRLATPCIPRCSPGTRR